MSGGARQAVADVEILAALAAGARARGVRTVLVVGPTAEASVAWVERLVAAGQDMGLVVVGVLPEAAAAPAPERPPAPLTLVAGPGLGLPPVGLHPTWQASLEGAAIGVIRRETRREELARGGKLLKDLGLVTVGVLWDDAGLPVVEGFAGALWDRARRWAQRPLGRWTLLLIGLAVVGGLAGALGRQLLKGREQVLIRRPLGSEQAAAAPVSRRAVAECVGRAVCPGLPPEPADEHPATGLPRPVAVALCADLGRRLPSPAEARTLQDTDGGLMAEWTGEEREGQAVVVRGQSEELRAAHEGHPGVGFRCVAIEGGLPSGEAP